MNLTGKLKEPIFLVGHTASGKTVVAVELAKLINGEIISADSRQIYKYLNIITAQPQFDKPLNCDEILKTKPLFVNGTPHYLISFLDPEYKYSAGEFYTDAWLLIKQIISNNKTPVIVGGTGLYIDTLINGIADLPTDINLRKQLYQESEKYGKPYLFEKLKIIDPVSSEKNVAQNLRRVIRALEVFMLTGIPLSQWHKNTVTQIQNPKIFGLLYERKTMYQNINQRVEYMWANGALNEINTVLTKGYSGFEPGLESIGCRHIIKHIKGEYTQTQMLELWKRDTRRYAKRQVTWFKRNKYINWFEIDDKLQPKKLAQKIVDNLGV